MTSPQTELEKANDAKDVKRLLLAAKRIPELEQQLAVRNSECEAVCRKLLTAEQQIKHLHQEQAAIRIACWREFDTPIDVDEDVLDLIDKIIDHHKTKEQELSTLRTEYKNALEALAHVVWSDRLYDSCSYCKSAKELLSSPFAIAAMKGEV